MTSFLRNDQGQIPSLGGPLWQAAVKQFAEVMAEGEDLVYKNMTNKLAFTEDGSTPQQVSGFLHEVLQAGRKHEPTVETGNKYGVSTQFHDMNKQLQALALKESDLFKALSPENQERAEKIFAVVFDDVDMRNRNCLHPAMLDASVIGNLLNFPKHIFNFPYGCHGTDGNEALSLCLFSYRQACADKTNTMVYYLLDENETSESLADVKLCAERVRMEFVTASSLLPPPPGKQLAVVMTSFDNKNLAAVALWAKTHGVDVHIHVRDSQWRDVFASNAKPVNYALPDGVQSLSIEEGLFMSGYTVCRDLTFRDRHLDVGYSWQTAYMSPNEGGSGASAPLFADFCTIMLGWKALGQIAKAKPMLDRNVHNRWHTTKVPANQEAMARKGASFDSVLEWANKSIHPSTKLDRSTLECELVCFQREFVGGKQRDLEVISSGGGTRSINLAYESVLTRARAKNPKQLVKVLTGNPHLAVERAERRFLFELIRLDVEGALSVDKLKIAIKDPLVRAVYTQTLSFTDGITDPLEEILLVIEEENLRRLEDERVTLINDSCLAFSVLVHNTGQNGSVSHRVLDLSQKCITPVLVTIDAHKHLGADKGISTIIGSPGTLSCLQGKVRVGAQPESEDLVRAIANMQLVGIDGYYDLYHNLGAAFQKASSVIEDAGMSIVHKQNKSPGSTVISVESKSGIMIRALKKKGHAVGTLYNLSPTHPERIQTGWQLSLTPYALRSVEGKKALDVFLGDVVVCHKQIMANANMKFIWSIFKENSLIACLAAGDLQPFLLGLLNTPGFGRELAQKFIRRFSTAQLDGGVIASVRRTDALVAYVKRVMLLCALAIIIFLKRKSLKALVA